tara:strand:+ start:737 stop:898 length:162 start_codon:yes stop_codon:yes gene_type:complete
MDAIYSYEIEDQEDECWMKWGFETDEDRNWDDPVGHKEPSIRPEKISASCIDE